MPVFAAKTKTTSGKRHQSRNVMIFSSPSWVPPISGEIPSSVPIGQFALDRNVRLPPQPHGRGPFVDAISGKWHPGNTLEARVDLLARALAKDLGWSPNEASPWDKVVAIYSLNTVSLFCPMDPECAQ